jgi:hypothetical protein
VVAVQLSVVTTERRELQPGSYCLALTNQGGRCSALGCDN